MDSYRYRAHKEFWSNITTYSKVTAMATAVKATPTIELDLSIQEAFFLKDYLNANVIVHETPEHEELRKDIWRVLGDVLKGVV